MFDNSHDIQTRINRKERILLMCEALLNEDNNEAIKQLFKVEQALLNLYKPKNFMGQQSYEVEHEKNYQMVCHGLNSHTNTSVKGMNVLEVYSLMEMLKKQQTQNGRKSD